MSALDLYVLGMVATLVAAAVVVPLARTRLAGFAALAVMVGGLLLMIATLPALLT